MKGLYLLVISLAETTYFKAPPTMYMYVDTYVTMLINSPILKSIVSCRNVMRVVFSDMC